MNQQKILLDVSTPLSENKFSRKGFYFKYWTKNQAGNGTKYSDKQEVTNIGNGVDSEITLYAQWEPNRIKINNKYYFAKIDNKIYIPCIWNGSKWIPYGEKPKYQNQG